ncbi:MAG TPA: EAL domain-containing protein [Acidimicrobiales bacterium]|nr:EAL domain-containing protein [Acidimicrobiales bacterium]
MKLPRSSRVVVALWAVGGLVTLALSLMSMANAGRINGMDVVFAAVFGTLLAATWIWPLTLFFDGESDGIDFDEGFFVLLILLVSPAMTVMVFAFVTLAAQAIRRRPLAKSIFNSGQVVTSVGVAALVFGLLHGTPDSRVGYAGVVAALAGAASYFVVNNVAMASIMVTLGAPWRRNVFGGLRSKLLVVAGGIGIAVPTALLLDRDPAYLPIAVIPLLIVRYLGAGQFYALHDRARLRGLFEATLEVNRAMGTDETKAAVLNAAGTLLRSPDVTLTATQPVGDGMWAPMSFDDRTVWLGVSGRSRTEPFDSADRALLDALASVGSVALSNAHLYGEVQHQREHLSTITSSLGEGVCAISESGDVTFMNPAGANMLGWYTFGSSAGEGGPLLSAGETPRFLLDPAMRAMSLRRNVTIHETRFDRPDGSHFPVSVTASPVVDGSARGAVIVFRDTSERKAFEEQLARHAFQDALTGLANRRLLLDHLDHALLQADRAGSQVAVLFCDVDRFKLVNDNLGHQVGDELLRVIGERLRRAVRPGDTLSRFGGDEFVILLEGIYTRDDAILVVDALLEALRDPVTLSGDHELVASLSIGVALSDYGKSRDDLLHDADVAMYRAKERGRGGQYAIFDADIMGGRSVGQLDLDTGLHHVVERDEIEVLYQPLVSLADRRIVGAEALVRWNHPEHGLLLPAQFIKLAEDNGTILPIGRAVFEQACLQAKAWHEAHGLSLQVGVNLSARQFQQDGLADEIANVIQATGVDPAQMCLEITESLAMDDVDLTSMILDRLHTLGVGVAIDDFGTGHSSLGYLARFPIDVVKIDQSFVRDIDRDQVKSAIVSAVVALSQAIGSTTVVEGVETVAQLEELKNLGCDVAQGFYFARPVSAASFDKLLVANSPTPDLRIVRGALAG